MISEITIFAAQSHRSRCHPAPHLSADIYSGEGLKRTAFPTGGSLTTLAREGTDYLGEYREGDQGAVLGDRRGVTEVRSGIMNESHSLGNELAAASIVVTLQQAFCLFVTYGFILANDLPAVRPELDRGWVMVLVWLLTLTLVPFAVFANRFLGRRLKFIVRDGSVFEASPRKDAVVSRVTVPFVVGLGFMVSCLDEILHFLFVPWMGSAIGATKQKEVLAGNVALSLVVVGFDVLALAVIGALSYLVLTGIGAHRIRKGA